MGQPLLGWDVEGYDVHRYFTKAGPSTGSGTAFVKYLPIIVFNPLRGYGVVSYVKQALLRKTCLLYSLTRYAGKTLDF